MTLPVLFTEKHMRSLTFLRLIVTTLLRCAYFTALSISMCDSTLKVSSGDDGLHADNSLTIDGGTTVTKITMNDENYGSGGSFVGGMGQRPRM